VEDLYTKASEMGYSRDTVRATIEHCRASMVRHNCKAGGLYVSASLLKNNKKLRVVRGELFIDPY
jgi:hypothetical protein